MMGYIGVICLGLMMHQLGFRIQGLGLRGYEVCRLWTEVGGIAA